MHPHLGRLGADVSLSARNYSTIAYALWRSRSVCLTDKNLRRLSVAFGLWQTRFSPSHFAYSANGLESGAIKSETTSGGPGPGIMLPSREPVPFVGSCDVRAPYGPYRRIAHTCDCFANR